MASLVEPSKTQTRPASTTGGIEHVRITRARLSTWFDEKYDDGFTWASDEGGHLFAKLRAKNMLFFRNGESTYQVPHTRDVGGQLERARQEVSRLCFPRQLKPWCRPEDCTKTPLEFVATLARSPHLSPPIVCRSCATRKASSGRMRAGSRLTLTRPLPVSGAPGQTCEGKLVRPSIAYRHHPAFPCRRCALPPPSLPLHTLIFLYCPTTRLHLLALAFSPVVSPFASLPPCRAGQGSGGFPGGARHTGLPRLRTGHHPLLAPCAVHADGGPGLPHALLELLGVAVGCPRGHLAPARGLRVRLEQRGGRDPRRGHRCQPAARVLPGGAPHQPVKISAGRRSPVRCNLEVTFALPLCVALLRRTFALCTVTTTWGATRPRVCGRGGGVR